MLLSLTLFIFPFHISFCPFYSPLSIYSSFFSMFPFVLPLSAMLLLNILYPSFHHSPFILLSCTPYCTAFINYFCLHCSCLCYHQWIPRLQPHCHQLACS